MDDLVEIREILESYPNASKIAASPSYVYFGIILETFAKEKLVGILWQHLVSLIPDQTDQLHAARRLREGLLKASPLVGFPRAINGLTALHKAIAVHSPSIKASLEADKSLRAPIPKDQRIARGHRFWDSVYTKHSSRILEHLSLISGGDLSEFAVSGVYGDLMAECSILSAKETGLLEFVACFASGAAPQAKGHMFGARNMGNARKEVESAVSMCRSVAKLVGVELDESEMGFLEKLREWE